MMGSPQRTPTHLSGASRFLKVRLRNDIHKTLMQFSYKQLLQDDVFKLFEIDVEDVVEKLKELKLAKSKKSVAELLSKRVRQAFSVEEMRNIQHSLMLYRTAFNNKQKRWFPIHLLEPVEHFNSSSDPRVISRDILQAFRIKSLNAEVKVIEHEDLMWLMVIEKKMTRWKGIKLLPPVFFSYEVGTPYLFTASGPRTPNILLECVVKALQWKSFKFQQLDGKQISSMLSLLKNKHLYKENLSNIEYESGEVEIGPRCIDYSQMKARKNYGNRVFDTKNPVLINSFTANVEAFWRANDLVPEMAGQPVKMKVTMVSNTGSIVDMMKDLQAREVINTPMPNFMLELIRSAKNKVRMRVNQGGNPVTQ